MPKGMEGKFLSSGIICFKDLKPMLTANINLFISLSQITASISNRFKPIHEFKNSQVAGWKLVFFVIHQEK
jgi:hypothetical protein